MRTQHGSRGQGAAQHRPGPCTWFVYGRDAKRCGERGTGGGHPRPEVDRAGPTWEGAEAEEGCAGLGVGETEHLRQKREHLPRRGGGQPAAGGPHPRPV